MGLDMYVCRFKKFHDPYLTVDKPVDRNYLNTNNYATFGDKKEVESSPEYKDIIPYGQLGLCDVTYIDIDKIQKDYKANKIELIGVRNEEEGKCEYAFRLNDNDEEQLVISRGLILEQYAKKAQILQYFFDMTEIKYWRKAYDIQAYFYDYIPNIENCGYYHMPLELIEKLNQEFNANLPLEDDLFYYEWY